SVSSGQPTTITQEMTTGPGTEFDNPNFIPLTIKSGSNDSGSTGSYVHAWQEILLDTYSDTGLVASAITDGTFDVQTASYTKQWQSDHGLKADGIVGPQTWQAALAIMHSDDGSQDVAQGDAFGREYGREYGRHYERIRPFHRHPQLAFLPLLVPDDSNPDLVSPEDSVSGDSDVVFAQDYGNYGQSRRHHHRHGDYQQGQSSYVPSPPIAPPSQSAFAPLAPPPPPPLQQSSSSPGQPPGVHGVGWI